MLAESFDAAAEQLSKSVSRRVILRTAIALGAVGWMPFREFFAPEQAAAAVPTDCDNEAFRTCMRIAREAYEVSRDACNNMEMQERRICRRTALIEHLS